MTAMAANLDVSIDDDDPFVNALSYAWPSGPYIPHTPTPLQDAFLWLDNQEALFGGAAGGGKSDALLMSALQYVEYPDYSCLILRKTFAELSLDGAIMDRSHKWLAHTDATWNGSHYRWTFPSGATLQFGYLKGMRDRARYQSAEYQCIECDELTAFEEGDYRFMFSRLRKASTSNIPLRMRSACVDEGDVLTDSGWKPIWDVQEGERVQSIDRHGHMSLKRVEWTYSGSSDGTLVRVDKKNLYMSMTLDHRVLYRKFGKSTYDLGPWDEHVGECISVVRTSLTYDAPGLRSAPLGMSVDDYMIFLGLFLSEGCTNSTVRRSNYKVVITQCLEDNAAQVAEFLDGLSVNYSYSANGDFQITKKEWWQHFRQFGKAHEKYVPRVVLNYASQRQLRLLFDSLVFGDGCVRGDSIQYVTVSQQLADDVVEIGLKLGYKAQQSVRAFDNPNHRDRHTVYLTREGDTTKVDKSERGGRNQTNVVPYKGQVYCIKVEDNETFFIRQNGKVWVSGNTNPGGVGGKWVKKRFVDPFQEYIKARQAGEDWFPLKRPFIPAKLSDNPHVDQESYRNALLELEPELIEMLLNGNWNAREPGNWMLRDPRYIDACEDLGQHLWEEHTSGRWRLPDPYVIADKAGNETYGLGNCIDWGEHTQGYVIWNLPNGGIFIPPSEVVKTGVDPVLTTKAMMDEAARMPFPIVQSNYDAAGIQSMRSYLAVMRKVKRYERLRSMKIPFGDYKKDTIGYLRTLARRSWEGVEGFDDQRREWEAIIGRADGMGSDSPQRLAYEAQASEVTPWRMLAIHPANVELCRQLRIWRRKDEESDEAIKTDDHGCDALVAGGAPLARKFRDYIEQEIRESYNQDEAYEDDPDALEYEPTFGDRETVNY